jgi:eukaryotic-like serine/threonine-protein kinase
MNVDPSGDRSDDRLQEVLASYFEAMEFGRAPDRHALLEGHPSLGDRLAEFFALQDEMRDLAGPTRALFSLETNGTDSPAGAGEPIIGDYELLGEIARGGMGIVYRARQRSLNRLVALKIMQDGPWITPVDASRFRNEAEAVASLDHPHIVPVYEVGEAGGRIYFSMKLIAGCSLAERLAEFGTDPGKSTRLMAAVARAVHHAHERGILHRDLKPSNILIDDQGRPLVVDFGLARRMDGVSELTLTGVLVGTPSYMAPEQASGQKGAVTTATDIHGLGVVLYAILAGRPPFRGDSPLAILEQVRAHIPEPPSTIRRTIDRDLETICLKCLEKDPKRRYASAAEVAEDLERRMDGRPIRARPMGWPESIWRLCRRNPRITMLAAASILLLVSTLIGILVSRRAHRDATRLAQEARRNEQALHRQQCVRDVKQAGELWADNRADEAMSLLERYRPEPGEEDLQGFAWHYFHRLCSAGRPPLLGHAGDVYYATFSPDGKTLATAGKDGTVRLWDPKTGAIRLILRGHTDEVDWVSYSPDGRTLATTGDDQSVKIWDAESGDLKATLTGHHDEVVAVIFTPDGRRLISCGRKGKVILWDPETSRECGSFAVTNGRIQSLAISPDGATLAIAGNRLAIWDLMGRGERRRLGSGDDPVNGVAFSHDGRNLATACSSSVHVWETGSWQLKASFVRHGGAVESVAFAPDDRILASVGHGGVIDFWDRTSGAGDRIASGQGRTWCVAFSPDGRSLATTSADATVKLWDLEKDRGWISVPVPTSKRLSLAFSPDGSRFSLAEKGDVWTYETLTGSLAVRKRIDAGRLIIDSLLSHDARRLVTSDQVGTVAVWDLVSGRPIGAFPAPLMREFSLAISPSGDWVAEGDIDHGIYMWDTASGSQWHLSGPVGDRLRLSPLGECSIWAEGSTKPRLWDPLSGRDRIATRPGHRLSIIAEAFSPDGKVLATASYDRTVILWDAESLNPLDRFFGAPDGAITAVAFSPDGLTLATGGSDRVVRLWDLKSHTELAALIGHSSSIEGIGFSPDGLALVTYSAPVIRHRVILWPAAPRGSAASWQGPSSLRRDSGKKSKNPR